MDVTASIVVPWHPVAAALFDELGDLADELVEGTAVHLSIRGLVHVGRVCIEHVRARVGRSHRAEFERLAALVDRHLDAPEGSVGVGSETPWQRDLHWARRDAEQARGALRIAATVAYAAAMELTAGGREASELVATAVRLVVRLYRRDPDALRTFAAALAAALAQAAADHPRRR